MKEGRRGRGEEGKRGGEEGRRGGNIEYLWLLMSLKSTVSKTGFQTRWCTN